ncbi:MAG: TonB-dependent receptor [Acidobacteriota bacterium]
MSQWFPGRLHAASTVVPLSVLLGVVLVAGAPSARAGAAQAEAEEADTREGEPRVTDAPAVLDEIVVTARKRAEDPLEVPIALTTISSEELETLTSGGQDVRFLSARVPSLVIESSFGRAFPRFYIRGLGNTDFDLNASQPVSMLYDDIVLENPILKGMPIWDIEQIEVLRGPQGSLFGRNTPAGAVKVRSTRPSADQTSYLRGSYGSFDTAEVEGAFGGRLGELLTARVSALYQGRSDWVDNGFSRDGGPGEDDALGSYQTAAVRVQLLFEPSERFSGYLNLHGWDVDGSARIFRANIIEPGSDSLVADFDRERVFQDGVNDQQIEGRGGVLELTWAVDGATVTSVTGYETLESLSRGDIDGGFGASFAPPFGPGFIPFPSETADGLPELDQFTQELRIASAGDDRGAGAVDWLAGVFLFDESLRVETFSYDSLGGSVQDGFAFQTQDTESWALFGTVGYRPTDDWKLQAGLRYSEDQKDFAAERPDPTFNTPTVAPIIASSDDDAVSWDLSATYTVNSEVNVYGRVATGFRAPSIQGRILFCPDFAGGTDPASNCVSVADQEEILSTEVGVKTQRLDNRLRWSATAYRYRLDDQQIVAVGGEFNTATLLNADQTEGYGVETDLQYTPSPSWLIKLGVSYNKTEIDDPNLFVTPCGGGCTVLDPLTPDGLARVDGNSLPHAPEIIVNGIVDYRRPVGSGLFVGSFDWSYHDGKSFFLYESEEFNGDAFEVGLRFAWVLERYELALFGRNITDEEIVRNGIDFNNLTGMVNEPRILGIELVRRF